MFNPSCENLADENCTDLWLADAAVRTMRTVDGDRSKPWALFVGFHKVNLAIFRYILSHLDAVFEWF